MQRDRISVKNILPKKYLILILIVFLFSLALFYYIFFTPNYYEGNSPKKFEIKKDETFSSVTARLLKEGIIPNETNFKIAGFIYGAETKVRAARYYIPNGLSYLDLLDLFIKGDADFLRKITISDGASLGWIASKLKIDAAIDSAAFVKLANDKNIVDSFGVKANDLQGYLLPDVYYLYERSAPGEVLDTFLTAFYNFINSSQKDEEINSKYSLHQILTLASIVEGETNKTEEMPAIAGVYYNRLRIGMRLQADPTVQYFQKNGWKRLLYKDLLHDHPYNTYLYYGLPPGPINNPGKSAISAALNPEEHDYLFFVADGKGGHKFARNYTQHLKNVKEYREWLKAQAKN